MEDNDLSQLMQ